MSIDGEPLDINELKTLPMMNLVSTFNKKLKGIIKFLSEKRPGDAEAYRLQKRLSTATSIDHSVLIKVSGPFLYAFKQEIVSGSADFFMSGDLLDNDRVKETQKQVQTEDSNDNKKIARDMINKIREIFKSFDDDEKECIIIEVQNMLKSYMVYKNRYDKGER